MEFTKLQTRSARRHSPETRPTSQSVSPHCRTGQPRVNETLILQPQPNKLNYVFAKRTFGNKDGTGSKAGRISPVSRAFGPHSIFLSDATIFWRDGKRELEIKDVLDDNATFESSDLKIDLRATTFSNATKTTDAKMNFVFRFQFQPGIFMKQELSIGDRVRISVLGASRCPRLASKSGTIVGGSVYTSSVSVRFDGNKSASTFHRDYVEAIASADSGE